MGRTPKQAKPIPEFEEKVVKLPDQTEEIPDVPQSKDNVPAIPEDRRNVPIIPVSKELNKEMPSDLKEENSVTINGQKIEIHPTKLKYFRNKTASVYNILKVVPLSEFLNYDKGIFDPDRDADQILYDFLIAVFDDLEFVKENYDNMTAGDIDKILKIFGRINGIDEKEEAARKNREAQAKH